MNKVSISLLAVASMGLASLAQAADGTPSATAPPISKANYETAKANAEAQYKVDDAACDSLSGNTKDICQVQAKGQLKVSNAYAEASFENTPAHREAARVTRAEAINAIAVERCDDLAGNGKDVCVSEAKAALVASKADAKVDRVMADTRLDAADKREEARSDAKAEKSTADYDVALWLLAGTA